MTDIFIKIKNTFLYNILKYYVLTMLFSLIAAFFISKDLWVSNVKLLHTFIELFCIFAALASFFVVWNIDTYNSITTKVIGFGFLSIATFDSFHTFYYPALKLYPDNFVDLSARYWIVSRLAEAIILLVASSSIIKNKMNKWYSLIITLVPSLLISFIILFSPKVMPVLLTDSGSVTLPKIFFEYILIVLFSIAFYKLSKKCILGYFDDFIAYKYICIAVLLVITSEFCFTLFNSITSFYTALGHILKLSCYYYLFKGIFVSSVIFPYEKLNETNNHTARLLNKLPIGIICYDSNLNLKFINQRAVDLIGYKPNELIGRSAKQVTNFLYKHCSGQIEVLANRLNGSRPSITNIVRTVTDKYFNKIKIVVDVHMLDSGEFVYLFNDAKKEQELINLQIQTYTILNSLGSIVIIYDKLGNIVMCNKAFETVTGLYSGNVIGCNIIDLYSTLQLIKNPLLKKFEGENSLSNPQFEITIFSVDGLKKNLILQTSTVLNFDGEVIGSVDIGTDISIFKEQQEKYLQQEKLALLGEMSAAVLHEAKNYLSTIKGSSQLMKTISSDERIKGYSLKIDHATNEINSIINNYLSSGNLQPKNIVKTSLNDIISSLKLVLENSSLINNVKISLHLDASDHLIECDKEQIKQVVLNICKNAIEAMSETKYPHLVIQTGRVKDKNELFIKITDNGKGISKGEINKIGNIFFTTKKFGSGLGLNICYKIINNHNGRIDIDSESGAGTSVCIFLPEGTEENENIVKIS